ncbi:MAG TPA: glycosyltransferase family 4 protein [Ignavibacteriaceae bacterium]|nr:glycosyltransferase family 4 protein [Ignavibacteriaceae bacterium]
METQKKKILIITTSTSVFGAETNMLNIIKNLYTSSKYVLHLVISGWSDGLFENKLIEFGIKDYTKIKLGWIYKSKILWTLDSFFNYIPAYIKYLRLQKSFKPDIIFINSYRHLFLLYPFIKTPVILRVQDQLSPDKQGKYILKKTSLKVLKYYVVSNFIKNDLLKLGIEENKIEVIYNGLEIPSPINQNKFSSQKIRIGIVGQVNPRKGHHILIKALNILKKDGYNFSLKIFGTGSEEYIKELKQTITEYKLDEDVEWKGYFSDKDKIYGEIDLSACPAILPESFGLTAIEPAIYKIPVITSDIGAFPEIIKEGINGFMFKNEDYLDLYKRLKYFFDNKSELVRIGNTGYEYVNTNFNLEKMIDKIKEMIESI